MDGSWSLEELSGRVAEELGRKGLLGTATDARVSAAPDARTVRYYATLGLVDRPRIENRQARYGERHLWQLLAVKALQSLDLPLAEIQQRLYGRSRSELEALVDGLAQEVRKVPAEVPALRMLEFPLEPGVRLVVEEGYAPRDSAALEQKIRAVVAALQPGGKR